MINKINILLVEDNPGDARLIQEMIGDATDLMIALDWVKNLTQCFEQIEKRAYNLILLDITLPDSHGLGTFLKVYEKTPHLPIILLTGFEDDELAIEAVRRGAQDYLVKDVVTSGLLLRSIRYAIERKKISDALSDSEERYRTLVETMSEGLVVLDQQEKINYVNQRFCNILKSNTSALIGQTLPDVFAEKNLDLFDSGTWPSLEHFLTPHEINLVDGDGESMYFLVSANLKYDALGNRSGSLVVFTDITELKVLENQLIQSQKMEAVGRLAGGVAHDFNNMLTAILGFSELLLQKSDQESEAYNFLQEIKKAGKSGAGLTRQLLAFSRKQVPEKKIISLNQLIGDLHKLLLRLIREDIRLTFSPEADLGMIKADPGQLEQVIVNLIVNARDAMPNGGSLKITTRTENSQVKKGNDTANRIVLEVADTGIGMDVDTKSKIFEPFFTTKAKGKGTGLGLSTVYGIIRQSDGEIMVESKPGKGTRFIVFFPECTTVKKEIVSERRAGYTPRGSETILLVEDEESVRSLLEEILKNFGYNVFVAQNGTEALKLSEEHGDSFQLMITDVVMPEMSGPELANHIEKILPQILVLFISGYTGDELEKLGTEKNLNINFLEKPFSPNDLLIKVREMLDRKNT